MAGFDHDDQQPDRGGGAGELRQESDRRRFPVGQFQVQGGLQFADGGIYNNLHKVMPRAAFSYLLGDKTVIRGGAGLFSYDYYFDAGNQTGFSQPTRDRHHRQQRRHVPGRT